jgi:hypothetical protein
MLHLTRKIYIGHITLLDDFPINSDRYTNKIMAFKREDDGQMFPLKSLQAYYHINECYPISRLLRDSELHFITDGRINRIVEKLNRQVKVENEHSKVLVRN